MTERTPLHPDVLSYLARDARVISEESGIAFQAVYQEMIGKLSQRLAEKAGNSPSMLSDLDKNPKNLRDANLYLIREAVAMAHETGLPIEIILSDFAEEAEARANTSRDSK